MEYSVSKAEITRRKKAYMTLVVSLLTGMFLTSAIIRFSVPLLVYFSAASILFLIGLFSFRFFHNLLQIKFVISGKTVQRITNKITEEYQLSDVYRVGIKRTTNNTVREINIQLNKDRGIFISALDRFELFCEELLEKLENNVEVKETKEPLDYDHPLFYTILGLIFGSVEVLIIKFVGQLSYQQIFIVLLAIFVYLLALSAYLAKSKQVSRMLRKV